MSLKSLIVNKLGFADPDNKNFKYLYNLSFDLHSFFDLNLERKELLKLIQPFTHVNYLRLKSLWDIAERLAKQSVNGDFVETGVWKGGTAGILSYISRKYGYKNKTYFFDSFQGMPIPIEADGEEAIKLTGKIRADDDHIKELLFNKLKINTHQVKIVKGWFRDTLPKYKNVIRKIALLRLDADWYESTASALDNLYPLVIPGGYVIIDDYYYWDGCRKAVDEFIRKKG
ncbi:hypothetical protein A2963_01210 [Candidatus Roizmanbacteria bacterium RIFCSPLOWO2_01_FULL_40_13]|nr:MAG: hypothetical protein A2963_01210 [Candidatus Roizmanbacteria bacterium RIFCSPLOWO2_01_FULL_40_13]